MERDYFEINQILRYDEKKLIVAVKKGYNNTIIELIKSGINIEVTGDDRLYTVNLSCCVWSFNCSRRIN
ncbi:MAG: hypothetical protein AB8U20_03880 [Rickettsiales endosymbiont of Dermacentor nuttalli]